MSTLPPILSRLLLAAEREISLLERCQASHSRAEVDRVASRFCAGFAEPMAFTFAPAPDLTALRGALEASIRACSGAGVVGRLHADRAEEVLLEARLVEARGTPAFRALAAARFPGGSSAERASAFGLATSWAALSFEEEADQVRAEDEAHPGSLLRRTRREVEERSLPFRVVATATLASSAATSDGTIRVRSGVSHGPRQGARIALHEVLGHAEPRARAIHESLPLFRTGTAGSSADEEGRALLIEEKNGVMDDARRRELGLRHLVALGVREGADFVESVRSALALGASTRAAVELASRVHRGGGLAREVIYLPALLRVREAFAREPDLEGWLARGRLSIDAARRLRDMGSGLHDDAASVQTTGV